MSRTCARCGATTNSPRHELCQPCLEQACADAAALYAQGLGCHLIARAQGITPDAAHFRLRRAGVALRSKSEASRLRYRRETA